MTKEVISLLTLNLENFLCGIRIPYFILPLNFVELLMDLSDLSATVYDFVMPKNIWNFLAPKPHRTLIAVSFSLLNMVDKNYLWYRLWRFLPQRLVSMVTPNATLLP